MNTNNQQLYETVRELGEDLQSRKVTFAQAGRWFDKNVEQILSAMESGYQEGFDDGFDVAKQIYSEWD